jgi:hypothetical protein
LSLTPGQLRTTLEGLRAESESPSILELYLVNKIKPDEDITLATKVFLRSYEEILYPASRYLAHQWWSGLNPVSFAPTVLDFGCTGFRRELLGGLRHLLRDKVFSATIDGAAYFYGHSGCVQCTGQILYTLSSIHKLYSGEEIRQLAPEMPRYMKGMLMFLFLLGSSRDYNKDWFGLFEDRNQGRERLQSLSYMAWAIQGLMRVLLTNRVLSHQDEKTWLEREFSVRPREVARLISNKWNDLCELQFDDLPALAGEASITHVLSDIGLCATAIEELLPSTRIPKFLEHAVEETIKNEGSMISKSRLIPPLVVLSQNGQKPHWVETLLQAVKECLNSAVWIRKGTSRGSYGYNADTTDDLAAALAAFWRFVFRNHACYSLNIAEIFKDTEWIK